MTSETVNIKLAKDVLIDSFTTPEINTLAACMLSAMGSCLIMYMSSGKILLWLIYIFVIVFVVFTIWMCVCVSDTSRHDFVNRIKSTVNIIKSISYKSPEYTDRKINLGNIFKN